MAALQTFEIGHILFRISILVGSVVLLLWISKNLVCKILMEKSNRKKIDGTRYEIRLSPPCYRVFPDHFFLCKFPTKIILESFNKATVHLNGCARRRARIFSPHEKKNNLARSSRVRMPELAWHAACTRSQNVHLKNLSFFFSQIKNWYFCLFFRANLTVLGVLVGSAGE
jgi:hypothetical protein